MSTKIPGIKACHAIVTPVCRENKDLGAFDEAIERLRNQYMNSVKAEANKKSNFHIVLTVEQFF